MDRTVASPEESRLSDRINDTQDLDWATDRSKDTDATPARTFFVRMVAQRELEVSEEEWFQVLSRHGMADEPEKDSVTSSSGSHWTASSNTQILQVPLTASLESKGKKRESSSVRDPEIKIKEMYRQIPIINVISPFSIYYVVWQYFMMIVDFTYTAFWVPYSVVFVLEDCYWNSASAILDFTVGWLYVLDIFMNLRVGYSVVYKLSRTLELHPLRAAFYYVAHGTFIVDLPATIPVFIQTACLSIDAAETSFGINLTQMMRLLRLLRLARALRLLLSDALDVASVGVQRVTGARMILFQFFQVVILFCWTAHLMACSWYYAAVLEDASYFGHFPHKNGKLWSCIEGQEEEAPDTWLKTTGLLCADNGQKYMAAFYFATMTITTVGYGDISANTTSERAVASVLMFLGAIFFGYIVSTTTLFMQNSARKEVSLYHDKIDTVDSWASNRRLPKHLSSRIRSYYSIVWSKADELENEKKLLLELPFPLRAAAAEHITLPFWEQITALSHIHRKHWVHLSRRLRAEWYPPGVFIAHSEGQGAGKGLNPEVDSLWILERGKIVCVREGFEFMTLTGPQVFGCSIVLKVLDSSFPLETDELAFMSTTPVWLWRINKEYLMRYLTKHKDALIEFGEGILVDNDQNHLLNLSVQEESKFYEQIIALKHESDYAGKREVEEGPLTPSVSGTKIFTMQDGGEWMRASEK